MMSSILCLAFAIYYEAGNQDIHGKLAVGQVVLNRVESGRYPDGVCQAVKQDNQFSFYSDGYPEEVPSKEDKVEYAAWEESYQLASSLLSEGAYGGHIMDNTLGAMHYHAYYTDPFWAEGDKVIIGDHIFYKGVK